MVEPVPTDAERWLAGAEVAPPFAAPASQAAWESGRQEICRELRALLGRLPPRPPLPKVETISRVKRSSYGLLY